MSSYETEVMEHRMKVQIMMNRMSREFIARGNRHDNSKLKSPEKEIYSQYNEALHVAKYGTPEYNELMVKIEPAVIHHYAENDHHPEHFKDGIYNMNLPQIIEMLADWVAAANSKGTNVIDDLPTLMENHGIPENFYTIFVNTIALLTGEGLTYGKPKQKG